MTRASNYLIPVIASIAFLSYSNLEFRSPSASTALLSTSTTEEEDQEKAAKEKFFLEKVRPILFDTCLKCHGPEKSENGLRVDSRKALVDGGEGGEAIVPEKPELGLLLKSLKYEDQDLQMPPDRKLDEKEIEAFEKWIKGGATWAEPEKSP